VKDNRDYVWDKERESVRHEYPYIETWISEKAKVIDLGCGSGVLLQILKNSKHIEAAGVEISATGVEMCKEKNLGVSQGRIDVKLDRIPDGSYDFAICNVTIQMVMNPEVVLQEMKRIARFQVVSFPNFAFIWQRLDLLFAGRMPRRLLHGYDWYDTGHIHQLSIADFQRTAKAMGLTIRERIYFTGRRKMPCPIWPNMLATEGLFLLEKSNG
jgi:methionine biosynthesis protein MetW